MELNRGRKVTSSNDAIFLQRVSNNRFLSRFSQYISISRVFNAWRIANHFAANSLLPSLPLSYSPSLSLRAFFYAFFFFFWTSVFFNFYLPLRFSRFSFALANTGILYIFRELLSSYFINIVVRVYISVQREQGVNWAVQTSNGGENEKKFPCLGM